MANSEESEECNSWQSTMEGLCISLNLDPEAAKRSMESFLEIKQNYSLDGDILHWMACALYVACRTSITPTVQSGTALEGNCVNLTRLLRCCNISLIQFFKKIKNWMEMAAMSNEFKERISRLERKFAVSTVLFRKFQPIFQEIFVGLTNEPQKKSKKHKLQPCTTNALFDFTWSLYISVKGEFHTSADDLVDMYHILLSCLDCVFANAFLARRTDLINPNFRGLPTNWNKDDFVVPDKAPCIISTLCEIRQGLSLEAATMKEYSWKPVIKSFFEKSIIKGKKETLSGMLDVGIFEQNVKSLNNLYETYVLSVGEFDERIFLGEHANEQIGTRSKVSGDEISQVIATFGPSARACPETPLTGRRYLQSRAEELTPVSEATHSLAKLAAFLRGARPMPSPALLLLFQDCGITEETINRYVIEPCNEWQAKLSACLSEANWSPETVNIRVNMITCFYYKVFEHIIREEHRKKPQVSLQMVVRQAEFQRCVFACCGEGVLHAYRAQAARFPRLLHVLSLHAFHFYKIIELLVHAVLDQLSRDLIKHLNAVEEEVLESLVWTSSSPLWEKLATDPVPPSTDVCVQESPFNRRSNERSSAPQADQARKQLFRDPIKPGQSLLSSGPSASNLEASTSQTPAGSSSANGEVAVTTPTNTPKKANNSLVLFFRKFYSLAVVRMNDLCLRLRLTDAELKKKIWTCLEYAVMHQTHLMRDRHLDQILMCTVYVICKVSSSQYSQVERTFAEIMRCYRQRPLADNHVYRSVLIDNNDGEGSPERGDLINFYNKVYVVCMQKFALKFHKDECCLSPIPCGRGDAAYSPCLQLVSRRHQLYVKPLTSPPPNAHRLTYRFSRSPHKDLHAINTMVSCSVGGASVAGALKREAAVAVAGAGAGAGGGELVKRPRHVAPGVARKLHGLMSDRQAV